MVKQECHKMANRIVWKKMGCKEYICPTCKRNKGMIYLFPDGTLRYVCFCGINITIDWIKKSYDFKKFKYTKEEFNEDIANDLGVLR